MNLLKLGGLIGLLYMGGKALARQTRSLDNATPGVGGTPAMAGLGAGGGSSTAAGNPGERLNAAHLSPVPNVGNGLARSSSPSGPGPSTGGLGDFSRGA